MLKRRRKTSSAGNVRRKAERYSMSDKKCRRCQEVKPLEQFHADPCGAGGKASRCKSCKREYYTQPNVRERNKLRMRGVAAAYTDEQKQRRSVVHRDWRNRNRHHVRSTLLMRAYGVTEEWYQETLTAQGGVCKICNKPPGGSRPLAVDHCHATGDVRGLLCYKCNRLMSLVDNPPLLEAALKYAKGSP